MELTAKEILEKHGIIFNEDDGRARYGNNKTKTYAAMKEIAELSFDKGFDRGMYVEGGHEEQKAPLNKTEFLTSLFPESK